MVQEWQERDRQALISCGMILIVAERARAPIMGRRYGLRQMPVFKPGREPNLGRKFRSNQSLSGVGLIELPRKLPIPIVCWGGTVCYLLGSGEPLRRSAFVEGVTIRPTSLTTRDHQLPTQTMRRNKR
jgi:hypothetical protein